MHQEGKAVSIAQLCRWFDVPRSTFYYRAERRRSPALDQALVELTFAPKLVQSAFSPTVVANSLGVRFPSAL